MANSTTHLVHIDWLDMADQRQKKWAQSHLRKKGLEWTVSRATGEKNEAKLAVLCPLESMGKLDRQMRAAWAKYKERHSTSDQKDFSFRMNKAVSTALHELAVRAGKPINQALESLILENHDLAQKYNQELKRANREYRENYHRRGQSRIQKLYKGRDHKQVIRLEKELNQAHKMILHLSKELSDSKATWPELSPSEACTSATFHPINMRNQTSELRRAIQKGCRLNNTPKNMVQLISGDLISTARSNKEEQMGNKSSPEVPWWNPSRDKDPT